MRVLIVEDDVSARRGLTELVRAWGYDAESAADGAEGLERVTTYRPSVVLADMVMPRLDGLGLLRSVKDQLSELTFILITAQGSIETAVTAMKEGAYDYLTKPVDPQRLRLVLGNVAERQDALREVATLRHQLQEHGRFGQMVGNAPTIRAVYRVIEQAAPTAASVLVYGESGTGKELVAKTIHSLSGRSSRPFVAINCAAIPESLLENEIFGHERGAYTGAVERRPGCFELAHTGTLFLDEIAEISPGIQAKLLARAAGTHRATAGRTERAGRRCSPDRGDERRPGQSRAAGQAARRPLLPHQRDRHLRAAAARSRRRYPAARPDVHQRVQRAERQIGPGRVARRAAPAATLLVARQHPGAAQRDRARGDSEPGRVHRIRARAGRSCRVPRRRRCSRPGSRPA